MYGTLGDKPHYLEYLGNARILDWTVDGDYRIWVYDRNVRGHADPFPGDPEVHGSWSSIGKGHFLIYLGPYGADLGHPEAGNPFWDYLASDVLDFNWEKEKGGEYEYRIYNYFRLRRGNADPLDAMKTHGWWGVSGFVDKTSELVYLDNDRLLSYNMDGKYWIYVYDRNAKGSTDPLPGGPEVWGKWDSISSY